MKKPKAYINGKIIPLNKAGISVLDRGLSYGDGVFESLRTFQGTPFQLEEHVRRLRRGAGLLRLRALPSAARLKQAVLKTIAANQFPESYIKIILTRGESAAHGLDPGQAAGKPTLIVLIEEQKPCPPEMFRRGWKAVISGIVRPDVPTSRIKSLNYLNNVLAKLAASRAGADEALLLDDRGRVIEGTISNLFIVKHGLIYTPPKDAPILPGLTRKLVIRLAKQSAFTVVEKDLTPKELYAADECFITFSGAGVVPVTRIWNRKIGSGQPGYITSRLIKLYHAETRKI